MKGMRSIIKGDNIIDSLNKIITIPKNMESLIKSLLLSNIKDDLILGLEILKSLGMEDEIIIYDPMDPILWIRDPSRTSNLIPSN